MRCSPALSTALVAFFGLSPALALPHQQQQPDCDTPDASNVINRDVVVIGAGSSGTHAALAIKDAGKSVIVVENQAQAGGHTHTYTDKATGATVDYGVLVFHNTSTVHEYFGRYKIPLTPVSFAAPREANFDFSTGKPIQLAQSNPQALQLAFQKYAGFLSKYTQLAGGLFLPNPVPQELLMPFGQLVKQLGLEAMVPIVNQFNPGQGDVLSVPVVENARVMSLQLIQQIAANGLLTTVRNNNSELYAAATAELQASNSILLSSSVIKSKRTQNGVELVVKTPKGVKHIRAKRLLMAIPPHLDNLKSFSPTQAERAVFSKLVNSGYYTALVKNTGIPLGLQISNRGANTPYNSPQLPASYIYRPTRIPGVNSVMFGTDLSSAMFPLDEQTIQGRVVAELKRLQTANQQLNFTMAEPEFVIAKYHSPFYQSFSAESIKAGAYGQMYALQGQSSTFWTGAAWRAEDSSALWDFNKQVVLPMLLKSL